MTTYRVEWGFVQATRRSGTFDITSFRIADGFLTLFGDDQTVLAIIPLSLDPLMILEADD